MNFSNKIPAWSYAKKKIAQFAGEEARYRGTFIYEVRVPAQPKNPLAEEEEANRAMDELYKRVYGAVGDEVPLSTPPQKFN